jgi:chromosome segregation ATPase
MEKEWLRPKRQMDDLDFDESEPTPAPRAKSDTRKTEDRVNAMGEQINELSRLLALKAERMSIKIKLIEERQQSYIEEFQKKLTTLNVKLSDKPRVDIMVQEIVEKHNQVIRTFENRLGQLKRVVENQEAELYKVMNELQEARRELARLKRT